MTQIRKPFHLGAKIGKLIREGEIDSDKTANTEIERRGRFYATLDSESNIFTNEAKGLLENYKSVFFNLNNPYKAFERLDLRIIETFGKVGENVFLYAAKDDENKYTLIEISFYKEKIKLKSV